jgi:hypothetical protein
MIFKKKKKSSPINRVPEKKIEKMIVGIYTVIVYKGVKSFPMIRFSMILKFWRHIPIRKHTKSGQRRASNEKVYNIGQEKNNR